MKILVYSALCLFAITMVNAKPPDSSIVKKKIKEFQKYFNTDKSSNTRVFGGEDTDIKDYPYIGSLRYGGSYICSAILISDTWLLTTASCVWGKVKKYSVRLGSSEYKTGGSIHEIKEKHVHPSYNTKNLHNNIALLKITKEAPIGTAGYKAIPLLEEGAFVEENTTCTVTGWGVYNNNIPSKYSKILKKAEIPVVSYEKCRANWQSILGYELPEPSSLRYMCAVKPNVDACSGDIGSPLVTDIDNKETLVGIFIIGACGYEQLPGVYANIAAYRKWIRNVSGI